MSDYWAQGASLGVTFDKSSIYSLANGLYTPEGVPSNFSTDQRLVLITDAP
jgi:hypothetical protein